MALRYATVYGERRHHRGVNALHIIASYERIKAGQPPILPGDGSEGHDYIYVGDVARATVMAMASEVSGESFVIATVDSSLNDIAQILLRLTGSSLQPLYQDQPGTVAATTKATLGYRPSKAKQLLGWGAGRGRGRHPAADCLGRRPPTRSRRARRSNRRCACLTASPCTVGLRQGSEHGRASVYTILSHATTPASNKSGPLCRHSWLCRQGPAPG